MEKQSTKRWAVLAAAFLVYAVGLTLLVMVAVSVIGRTPESSWASFWVWGDSEFDMDRWWAWWLWCAVPVLVIAATQVLFIAPIVDPDLSMKPGGRPMVLSLIAIAVVAAGLSAGLLCAVLELLNLWGKFTSQEWWGWPTIPLIFVFSWAVWSWLFVFFTDKTRDQRLLGRLVGLLLGGTVIEVLAVLPVDLMVRRRTECYCSTGTFNALLFATLAAIWLAGPGVLILYLRRRRKARTAD